MAEEVFFFDLGVNDSEDMTPEHREPVFQASRNAPERETVCAPKKASEWKPYIFLGEFANHEL